MQGGAASQRATLAQTPSAVSPARPAAALPGPARGGAEGAPSEAPAGQAAGDSRGAPVRPTLRSQHSGERGAPAPALPTYLSERAETRASGSVPPLDGLDDVEDGGEDDHDLAALAGDDQTQEATAGTGEAVLARLHRMTMGGH